MEPKPVSDDVKSTTEPLIPDIIFQNEPEWDPVTYAVRVNGQIVGYAMPESPDTPASPITNEKNHLRTFEKLRLR